MAFPQRFPTTSGATGIGSAAPPSPGAGPVWLTQLNTVLDGDLARFTAGVAALDDPRASIQAADLLDGGMVAAIIARFEGQFGATDRRAIMSMWASIYFAAVLPPLLAANILLGVEPALDLGGIGFIVAPSLKIESVKVGHAAVVADTSERFDCIIKDHLGPFIALVADRAGVAPRLLWSNAGNVFEAFVQRLKTVSASHPGFDQALQLLGSRLLSNGDLNPLFQPVRYLEGRRVRRICCLRYLIPTRRVCGVCPLPADNPARG